MRGARVLRAWLTVCVASTLLIAYTSERKALVYSLPYLEHMHTLQLPSSESSS